MEAELRNVIELVSSVASDTTVPRNIRLALDEARRKLQGKDLDVGITGAIYLLDDISNDINMPSHTRTEIWQIISDLETIREPGPRLIGNVAIEADLGYGPRLIAGFENHGGRTYLGDGAKPLGRVVNGFGNNGKDGLEGVRRDNLIGTYLHGPLLPKNAWLADHLIALALERRYGTKPELAPLDDTLELAAHESARKAATKG